jgi:hypothetical protein
MSRGNNADERYVGHVANNRQKPGDLVGRPFQIG